MQPTELLQALTEVHVHCGDIHAAAENDVDL
jgi:hypothetical protein